MKKISEKIAQIRLEPEHVRMRYVWGSITVCMIVIFSIWIFSISTMFQKQKDVSNQPENKTDTVTKQLQELKQQTPSIKDFTEKTSSAINEGLTNASINSEFQYPADNTDETLQANSYDDLQKNLVQ